MAAGKTQHVRRFYHYEVSVVYDIKTDKTVIQVHDTTETIFISALSKHFKTVKPLDPHKIVIPVSWWNIYFQLKKVHKIIEKVKETY